MKKYRKYVFTEAHRKFAVTKKYKGTRTFAEHLKNSWFLAKLMYKRNIEPYTN